MMGRVWNSLFYCLEIRYLNTACFVAFFRGFLCGTFSSLEFILLIMETVPNQLLFYQISRQHHVTHPYYSIHPQQQRSTLFLQHLNYFRFHPATLHSPQAYVTQRADISQASKHTSGLIPRKNSLLNSNDRDCTYLPLCVT
jgi:hypothetical protein